MPKTPSCIVALAIAVQLLVCVYFTAKADQHSSILRGDTYMMRSASASRSEIWAQQFDADKYRRLGGTIGSATLQRELEAMHPNGGDVTHSIQTLVSAGFNCASFFSTSTWKGCSYEIRRNGEFVAIITIKIEYNKQHITKKIVDMAFPAVVW